MLGPSKYHVRSTGGIIWRTKTLTDPPTPKFLLKGMLLTLFRTKVNGLLVPCQSPNPRVSQAIHVLIHLFRPKTKIRIYLLSCCHSKSSIPVIGMFVLGKSYSQTNPLQTILKIFSLKNNRKMVALWHFMTHPFWGDGISQLEAKKVRHGDIASMGVMKDARTVLRESLALVSVRVSTPGASLGLETDVVYLPELWASQNLRGCS